jgi:threonine dehydrogenase-like Zn-dependent dehydrogenase
MNSRRPVARVKPEMAELVRSGLLDLSVFEHQRFALDDINRAISGLQNRNNGFSNCVIVP